MNGYLATAIKGVNAEQEHVKCAHFSRILATPEEYMQATNLTEENYGVASLPVREEVTTVKGALRSCFDICAGVMELWHQRRSTVESGQFEREHRRYATKEGGQVVKQVMSPRRTPARKSRPVSLLGR
ncbi:LOW QUALITY PROTEIN: Low-density lipoprotein receptor-related protein 8-like [Phytophthora palmivora]|uniref:Low-density lipoprotein receptor-related protein 8-like n=1 Tax=Phytophthora palmivora TaxID=4796 RepID=A0A2P4WWR6_9STRA|nr:LOW QUALITY PROTEIN: Low-density lipoprotein receptor-related protein 8-like [Phytophthora palmivora]